MLIIRGINVYPREIEAILLADKGVAGTYAIVVDRRGTLTELVARVELADATLNDQREEIRQRLEAQLAETIRIRVTVEVRDVGAIPRPEMGKAKRVFFRDSDADPVV
jgi:phenylacetate-CoA ligase